jgi:hypothetical protein
VAYTKDWRFAEKIDRLVEAAKTWEGVPSPGDVWDMVRGESAVTAAA